MKTQYDVSVEFALRVKALSKLFVRVLEIQRQFEI